MKPGSLIVAGVLAAVSLGSAAHAERWDYRVTPYIWGPDLETSLNIGPNPPVNGSTSIFDILDGAFLIAGEARKGRWSIGGEFNYLNLGDDVAVAGFDNFASWDLKGTMATLGAAYAFYDYGNTRIEALAAVRNWDLDIETTVAGRTASADVNWTDPLIGARYSQRINDRLRVTGMANIGGFDVGSHFQWEALAELNWAWTDRVDLAGGYRHLKVDFERGSDVVDLTLTGPYVAVAFKF
ncbi:hypothetical protein Q5Y75_06245 [Ruegeria sp. 2205SS24-7]|uniref:hypothetical protein n=1 Tax=Ruegeria discodermiae TaxID=3064389 RepID=UPI002740A92C|nr:hypothetical protein [Ruegeria sp. 2205SS24-7]MDP5216813.1 hypothetical protein [Ruegeria sp. 2205SS24-7]